MSTNDAIAELTKHIYNAIDKSKKCAAVFVDLAKAFDTVCHKRLLLKLESVGIRGTANSLFQSYLEERLQTVEIKGQLSNTKKVSFGVPQGTVVSPLLFDIYIDGLLRLNLEGKIFAFADDQVFFTEGDTWHEVENNIKTSLSKIIKWLDMNLLSINPDKTVYVPFSNYNTGLPAHTQIEIPIACRNTTIKISSAKSAYYLGITIDSHLKWDVQIQNVNRKLRSLIYLFKQTCQIVDFHTAIMVYYGLVQSILYYGILAWGGAYGITMRPLEITQKRILKIICKVPIRYPTENIFKLSGALSIKDLFYKCSLNYIITKNIGNLQQHNYDTRFVRENQVVLPKMLKTKGQSYFIYVGQKIFNIVPTHLKNIKQKEKFNNKIKKWLLQANIQELL